jgi:hypothetical protein
VSSHGKIPVQVEEDFSLKGNVIEMAIYWSYKQRNFTLHPCCEVQMTRCKASQHISQSELCLPDSSSASPKEKHIHSA